MSGIAESIFQLNSVQKQIRAICIESVSSNFENLVPAIDPNDINAEIDWNNILSCASILHQSQKFDHLDAALRIAQHCLNSADTTETHKSAAATILEALTNKPAIELAQKRNLLDSKYKELIPMSMQLEIIGRDIQNTILDENGGIIYLNKFQKSVYDSYLDKDLLSISAPTSAGKSFILGRIILEEITKHETEKNIVFIVPTRALINQVEQDIREILSAHNISNVILTSVPQAPDAKDTNVSRIFVFTQERLHWFRTEVPQFRIDLLIVDEAHKIEDGNRGILLQQKIEELISDFPNVKVYFSSPFTSNPEILLSEFPGTKSQAPIKTEFVSVNQNLVYVKQKRNKPLLWELSLSTKQEQIPLGEITLPFRPNPESKRLIFVAAQLADPNGGNIIYINGAAYAEKAALILYDTLPAQYENISDGVEELIKLVKKTVHSKYALAKALKKKIAFHYGNMPLIIRQEIERLFKTGEIHFIICTSTLLEGVNLPAKSIFIRKPTRGSGNPMNESDFWNLAGRAGRWGKEFQGNVVCVEPDLWENKPSMDRSKHTIKRAVSEIVNKKDKLVEFIKKGSPRSIANGSLDLEYAFAYFYIRFIRNQPLPANDLGVELLPLLEEVKTKITIPSDIIMRNPGVSPLAQQNLLDFFASYTGELDNLIPTFPESENAATNSYQFIVQIINEQLSGDPVALAIYQSILIVNWMKGYPLSVLIENSYKYWKNKGEERSYDKVIRDVMKDVEEFARFKFAKYSGCYIDILRYFLRANQREDLLKHIPDLHIWLEFGVSQQTQVSLIGLGLSRNTAITLSEFIANDSLNPEQCREWLLSNNVLAFQNISPIMINEVKSILK